MAGLSARGANLALDACLGSSHAANWPATLHLGLLVGPATRAFDGVEAAGATYGRVAVANDDASWTAAVDGQKSNATTFDFALAGEDWGSIVGWGLYDDPAAGNLVLSGIFGVAWVVPAGTRAHLPPGTVLIDA